MTETRIGLVAWPHVIGAALLLLALEAATLLPIRLRLLLVVNATVLLGLVLLRLPLLRADPRLFRSIGLGVAVTAMFPILALPIEFPDRLGPFTAEVLALLAGWSALLVVLPALTHQGPGDEPGLVARSPSTRFGWLVGAGLLIAVVHQVTVGQLAIISDEATYLLQSRWMTMSDVVWEVEAELAPFFVARKVDYLNGHLYGMYPPGWPALLALFRTVGLEWWSGVVLGTLSLGLTYRVGCQLQGAAAGWYAALLLATSQIFLVAHAGYMAHAALIFALLGALWAMLAGLEREGWSRRWAWIAAGVLLAFGVTVRPLATLALGGALSVWMLARAARESRGAAGTLAGYIVLGGAVPGLLFMAHNVRVFGDPFALGYDIMHPGMYSLGFGQRGFMVLNEEMQRVPFEFPFTPQLGLRSLLIRLSGLNTAFVPIGLLGPVVVAAVAAGVRVEWRLAALMLPLPLVHVAYWGSGLRMYTELLPFMFLGIGALLVGMAKQGRRQAPGTLVALLIAAQAIVALPWPATYAEHRPWALAYGRMEPTWETLEEVVRLKEEHGRLLLFAREDSEFDNLIDRLYPYNGDRFDGPILVARDRGALNSILRERFPDRVAYLLIDRGGEEPAEFLRLDPP